MSDFYTIWKRKKASLAITELFKSNLKLFDFSIACFNASTLDVCPVPELINCRFLAKTIVFDLVCLQIFEANSKSLISELLGDFFVQFEIYNESVTVSLSCERTPFKQVLNC